jgi:hypothetical protein
MTSEGDYSMEGGCTCGAVRYRMTSKPMFVHCCHCRWCQRLWSNYAGAGDALHFIRVGTLDEPDRLTPDVHIYTSSKQPWVVLPPGTPAFEEYYDRNELWPEESLARRRALFD